MVNPWDGKTRSLAEDEEHVRFLWANESPAIMRQFKADALVIEASRAEGGFDAKTLRVIMRVDYDVAAMQHHVSWGRNYAPNHEASVAGKQLWLVFDSAKRLLSLGYYDSFLNLLHTKFKVAGLVANNVRYEITAFYNAPRPARYHPIEYDAPSMFAAVTKRDVDVHEARRRRMRELTLYAMNLLAEMHGKTPPNLMNQGESTNAPTTLKENARGS